MMNRQVKAIYENGVFRPLEPVALEEHREVILFFGEELKDNLADLASVFFGEQGIDLTPHPSVPVRNTTDFGE